MNPAIEEMLTLKRKLSVEANKNVDEEEKLIRSIGDLEHMRKSLRYQKLDDDQIGSAGGHLNKRVQISDQVYHL
jgi:hypothetical protein